MYMNIKESYFLDFSVVFCGCYFVVGCEFWGFFVKIYSGRKEFDWHAFGIRIFLLQNSHVYLAEQNEKLVEYLFRPLHYSR